MIISGVALTVIGYLFGFTFLVTIGVLLAVGGLVLYILGANGRPVGGRPHYW